MTTPTAPMPEPSEDIDPRIGLNVRAMLTQAELDANWKRLMEMYPEQFTKGSDHA